MFGFMILPLPLHGPQADQPTRLVLVPNCPQHLWISVEGIGKALCQDYDFLRDSGESEGWLKS
jgi:hypothetical protein